MINVFVATMGRLNQAKRIIRNLYDTSDCNIIMAVGQNQEEFLELVEFKHKTLPGGKLHKLTLHFEPYSPSFSYAINASWGRLREYIGTSQNILGLATCDDNDFKDGWDVAMLKCYESTFPNRDGLMFMNDLRAMESKSKNVGKTGLCVVSAKFCDRYMGGWLVSPYYHCSGIDMEYAGISEQHGKQAFCEDSQLYHLMHEWEKTKNSEQRKLGIFLMNDRPKRDYIYDIHARWRHWKND